MSVTKEKYPGQRSAHLRGTNAAGGPGASSIAVLNCGAGDTKFTFDSNAPDEVDRARDIVTDMLRRGYCISINVGGKMERVTAFDPKTDEYEIKTTEPAADEGKPKGKPGRKKVPAKGTSGVAVGRTAGGGLCGRAFPVRRGDLEL